MLKNIAIAALVVLAGAAQAQSYQRWMSPEVKEAWAQGYRGQGTNVLVVDQFSGTQFPSYLTGSAVYGTHGDHVARQTSMIAPSASVSSADYGSATRSRRLTLGQGFNVINASYGLMAPAGRELTQIGFAAQEASLIEYAKTGKAVIIQAAGNDGLPVGSTTSRGTTDYLGKALAGTPSTILVGSLAKNGTTSNKASLVPYSNTAGSDSTIQRQFLVVGVDANYIGLSGTSFAAPIVSGYAAIVHSKFTQASPTQVANQLLTTARKDTIKNYSASMHGRGEASLARALAPVQIN